MVKKNLKTVFLSNSQEKRIYKRTQNMSANNIEISLEKNDYNFRYSSELMQEAKGGYIKGKVTLGGFEGKCHLIDSIDLNLVENIKGDVHPNVIYVNSNKRKERSPNRQKNDGSKNKAKPKTKATIKASDCILSLKMEGENLTAKTSYFDETFSQKMSPTGPGVWNPKTATLYLDHEGLRATVIKPNQKGKPKNDKDNEDMFIDNVLLHKQKLLPTNSFDIAKKCSHFKSKRSPDSDEDELSEPSQGSLFKVHLQVFVKLKDGNCLSRISSEILYDKNKYNIEIHDVIPPIVCNFGHHRIAVLLKTCKVTKEIGIECNLRAESGKPIHPKYFDRFSHFFELFFERQAKPIDANQFTLEMKIKDGDNSIPVVPNKPMVIGVEAHLKEGCPYCKISKEPWERRAKEETKTQIEDKEGSCTTNTRKRSRKCSTANGSKNKRKQSPVTSDNDRSTSSSRSNSSFNCAITVSSNFGRNPSQENLEGLLSPVSQSHQNRAINVQNFQNNFSAPRVIPSCSNNVRSKYQSDISTDSQSTRSKQINTESSKGCFSGSSCSEDLPFNIQSIDKETNVESSKYPFSGPNYSEDIQFNIQSRDNTIDSLNKETNMESSKYHFSGPSYSEDIQFNIQSRDNTELSTDSQSSLNKQTTSESCDFTGKTFFSGCCSNGIQFNWQIVDNSEPSSTEVKSSQKVMTPQESVIENSGMPNCAFDNNQVLQMNEVDHLQSNLLMLSSQNELIIAEKLNSLCSTSLGNLTICKAALNPNNCYQSTQTQNKTIFEKSCDGSFSEEINVANDLEGQSDRNSQFPVKFQSPLIPMNSTNSTSNLTDEKETLIELIDSMIKNDSFIKDSSSSTGTSWANRPSIDEIIPMEQPEQNSSAEDQDKIPTNQFHEPFVSYNNEKQTIQGIGPASSFHVPDLEDILAQDEEDMDSSASNWGGTSFVLEGRPVDRNVVTDGTSDQVVPEVALEPDAELDRQDLNGDERQGPDLKSYAKLFSIALLALFLNIFLSWS